MWMRFLTLIVLALLAMARMSGAATTDCQSTFYANSGTQAALAFCVTVNGNVAQLATAVPQVMDGAEGYALCGPVGYWDLGAYGDSGNWAVAQVIQPGGAGTFPLRIVRSSLDGRVTLTQDFSLGSGGRSVHVKMTVEQAAGAVGHLYRYAHVAWDGSGYGDHGMRSAFVWASGGFGLMAAPALVPRVAASLLAAGQPADPCRPVASPPLPYHGDSVTLVAWDVAAAKKPSVSFDYVPIR